MKNRFLLLMVALGLLVSCNNILDRDGDGVKNSSDGGTYLVIGSASMERTLYPVPPAPYESFQDMLTELKLEGVRTSSDGKTVDEKITLAPAADSGLTSLEKFSDLVGKPIPIQTGSWDFTLTAKLDNVEFSGTVTKEIIAGETNTISFNLAASGAGGINITVQFTNTNVTKVVAELRTAGSVSETPFESKVFSGSEQIKDATIKLGDGLSIEGHEVSFVHDVLSETPLPSGSYLLNFDFYDDDFKLNSIPYIVRVADGLSTDYTQKIELNDTYTVDYLEIVDDVETNVNEDEFVDSIVTKKYSRKMEFSLPQMKREGKIFGGWYTDLSNKDSAISEVKKGTTANLKLYAKWYSPELYVSAKGLSENNGYEEGSALDSIATAVSKIESLTADVGVVDWTIYVCGEVVGAQEIGQSIFRTHANSLVISGLHNNKNADGKYTEDGYQDILKGESDKTVLDISTQDVPVTIRNVKITGGSTGVVVNFNETTLEDGTWISGNNSAGSAGGVHLAGTMYMKDGATITGNHADFSGGGIWAAGSFYMEGGTIYGNSCNSSGMGAGACFSGTIFSMSGNASIPAGDDSENPQDLYLMSEVPFKAYCLTVGGELTGESPVATLTFGGNYSGHENNPILKTAEGVTLTEEIISKFAIVQPEYGSLRYKIDLEGNFVKKTAAASSGVTTDNRALNIAINTTALYLNTTVRFSVTDANGNPVSDSVTYGAKLLYKGDDVNELGNEPYYSVDTEKGILRLSETNPLPKEGAYQLYVTASQVLNGSDNTPVTSSQTFDVTFVNEIGTPDTQVALYNYSNSNYTYYLVDAENVSNALPAESFVTEGDWHTKLNFAFDKSGYFYYLDSREVHSNNPVIYNLTNKYAYLEDLPNSTEYPRGFMLDVTQDMAYGYGVSKSNSTYSLEVYQFSKLLTEGKSGSYNEGVNTISINISAVTNFVPLNCAIDDNRLYVYGVVGTSAYAGQPYLIIYDITSSETNVTATKYAEYNLYNYIKTEIHMGQFATEDNFSINDISVTDLYVVDGKLYLLVKENFTEWTTTNKNIYSRGTVIEVTPPSAADGTCTAKHVEINTNPTIANTAISKMPLCYNYGGPLYSEGSETSPVLTIDGSKAITTGGTTLCNAYFPNVYGVSSESAKFFAAPSKVIGIKPKKLIIADDGYAFYTDDDVLAYKNMNRVVTVDLEEFVIENVQTTKAEFEKNASSYMKSSFTLSTMVGSDSYYDDSATGYWFESSGCTWENITIGTNKGDIYLCIRKGE